MSVARFWHTVTALQDGRVLVAGGVDGYGNYQSTAELFDPTTGKFGAPIPMTGPRAYHAAVLLPSGKVMLIGGSDGSIPLASADLFDPTTNVFVRITGSMHAPRAVGILAVLLTDGLRVLIAGGGDSVPIPFYDPRNGTCLASAEVYTISTQQFAQIQPMNFSHCGRQPVVLPTHNILIIGGPSSAAEEFNSQTNTFAIKGDLLIPSGNGIHIALPSGRVLVAGGSIPDGFTADAELYRNGTFVETGALNQARTQHTGTPLLDGEVLITGGYTDSTGALVSSELYSDATASFTYGHNMGTPRLFHQAATLPDGSVLLVGGISGFTLPTDALSTAEILPGLSLSFPVRADPQCHNICTPGTAPINAVFDHQMLSSYSCGGIGYSQIGDFRGETAGGTNNRRGKGYGACEALYGYYNQGYVFLKTNDAFVNYTGGNVLYYDSHPGYDYNFTFDTKLYAATSGCVSYNLAPAHSGPPSAFHVLAIVPVTSPPPGGCANFINTATAGYFVYYLHLASYFDGSRVMHSDNQDGSDPYPCSAPRGCAQPNAWVAANTPIGYSGNFANKWKGVSPHLHFEVDIKIKSALKAVDPYGWHPTSRSQADWYTIYNPGFRNNTLWNPTSWIPPQ